MLIFVLCVVSLVAVHSTIASLWQRDQPIATSQWGQNLIRTERFLYSSRPEDCVLVGSSMSANLDLRISSGIADLPSIQNLAYAGGGALEGLQVVAQSGLRPKCVLVEANLAYQVPDEEVFADAFHPVWHPIRRWVRNFRHENQPLNMLLTGIRELRDLHAAGNPDVRENAVASNRQLTGRPDSVTRLVLKRASRMSQIPQEMIEIGVRTQVQLANTLQARGINVIFFLMPGEEEVRASPYYQRLRQTFATEFQNDAAGADAARELQIIDIGPIRTNDGIHLTPESLKWVPEQLFQLINRPQ